MGHLVIISDLLPGLIRQNERMVFSEVIRVMQLLYVKKKYRMQENSEVSNKERNPRVQILNYQVHKKLSQVLILPKKLSNGRRREIFMEQCIVQIG